MTIIYEIKFLDYWHIGSGLSAGTKLDSSVLKNDDQLPYIPGKTVKGLVREMAEMLDNNLLVEECFGNEGTQKGAALFSNATLDEDTQSHIHKHTLQEYLYDEIASTSIDAKTGIAKDNSLREIEVVVPLSLYGSIENIPESYGEAMCQSLKMVKRMGLNRNRGLGRCEIKIKEAK